MPTAESAEISEKKIDYTKTRSLKETLCVPMDIVLVSFVSLWLNLRIPDDGSRTPLTQRVNTKTQRLPSGIWGWGWSPVNKNRDDPRRPASMRFQRVSYSGVGARIFSTLSNNSWGPNGLVM